MRDSKAEFQFIDFAKRSHDPEPRRSPLRSVSSKPRANDDGLNAARGILIGSAIGLAIWGALFGVWLLA